MDQSTYHVLLDGRTVGPYDRRTILGMRIKHMLTGDHLVVTEGGARLTVRELFGSVQEAGDERAASPRSARVQATYTGMLVAATRGAFAVPRFAGELEIRLQTDVLRLAGRCRRTFRWRDGRIKLPLADIVYARAKGPRTDVWFQPSGSSKLQRLALYLFTSEAAEELAARLAAVGAKHPALGAAKAAASAEPSVAGARVLVVAVGGAVLVVGLVLLALLYRRV